MNRIDNPVRATTRIWVTRAIMATSIAGAACVDDGNTLPMEPGVVESGPATHQIAPGIAAGAVEPPPWSPLIGPGSLINAACLAAPADTTLAFGIGVSSVSANSESLGFEVFYGGAGYADYFRDCQSYVVDIDLTSPRNAPARFKMLAMNKGAWPSDPEFSSLCDGREESTFVYRRLSSEGGYTLVAKKIIRGEIIAHQCIMQTVSNVWPTTFQPPRGTTETYRVITRASDRFTTNWYSLGVLYWHRLVIASKLVPTT